MFPTRFISPGRFISTPRGRISLRSIYNPHREGLYSGERLSLEIEADSCAAAEVTTQASTLVRNARGDHAAMETRLNSLLTALRFIRRKPLVLFPNAKVKSKLGVTYEPGARALCQEAFALSSEDQGQALTGFYEFEFSLKDASGTQLVLERGAIDLAAICTLASPLGRYRAAASVYLIGCAMDKSVLTTFANHVGCPIGASALPNNIGVAIRILAMDGGSLNAAMQSIRQTCFRAVSGFEAAPRRK